MTNNESWGEEKMGMLVEISERKEISEMLARVTTNRMWNNFFSSSNRLLTAMSRERERIYANCWHVRSEKNRSPMKLHPLKETEDKGVLLGKGGG